MFSDFHSVLRMFSLHSFGRGCSTSLKRRFFCRRDDACNAGFVLMVRTCSNFWMRWDSFAFIDRMKEFGKFIWRDNKKRIDHHL